MKYGHLIKSLIKNTLRKVMEFSRFNHSRILIAIDKLKKLNRVQGINELVDFAFSFSSLGIDIRPSQVKEEITKLLQIIQKISPKVVLEIGTANGGTLFLFTRIADPRATIISIDLPEGSFGGGYLASKIPLYKSFAGVEQKMWLIGADSHDLQSLAKVMRILGRKKVDFLFIDGDHTYQGVKKDFQMYSPLVRQEGIIALHDIVRHSPQTLCEVDVPHAEHGGFLHPYPKANKFWNEIKHDFRHIEIVKNNNQYWAGIGVLYQSLKHSLRQG